MMLLQDESFTAGLKDFNMKDGKELRHGEVTSPAPIDDGAEE